MRSAWRLVPVVLLTAAVAGCSGKERYTVTIRYAVAPRQPLPPGLKAVAVIDSGVQTIGAQQDDRDKKWSLVAADMIEAMLQGAAQRYGTGPVVAKRRETSRILAEQDLKLAGLVDGPTATRAAKLLDVQGLITSRITVRIDVQKGTKSTIDWASIMGGVVHDMQEARGARRPPPRYAPRDPRYARYPYDPRVRNPYVYRRETTASGGGVTLHTKEVEEISRHLTVQCSFSLIDAATGQALGQYSPPPYQKTDTRSPHFLFGSAVTEADLDPVDHFIGELVERAVQEFVGMFVPTEVECRYELTGRGKEAEAAIRALRADDYATAIAGFEAALRKKPNEHEHVFAMGVTYELMGDRERALECYRRAAAMEDVDKDELARYLAAKTRLTEHMGRILRPAGQGPSPPAGPTRVEPPPPATASPAPPPAPARYWTWSLPATRPATQPTTMPR